MRRRGRTPDLPFAADVNVTSLVDVAFTLLVIFIITAPVLQGGVEVNVPQADVRPLSAQDKPLLVSIQRDGTVFIEDTPMSIDEFRAAFPQLYAAGATDVVWIRADSAASWAPVLQVITVVQKTGARTGVVGEPWTGR